MKFTAKTLPDDPDLLKQMVLAALAESEQKDQKIAQQTVAITSLKTTVKHQDALIEQLKHIKRLMQQRTYGSSAENSAQLDLLQEDLETVVAGIEHGEDAAAEAVGKPRKERTQRRRAAFPDALERTPQTHEPNTTECMGCGNHMEHIGDDVSEMLDVKPVEFEVIQIVRPKYACKCCNTIAQAPAVDRVIDKGMATARLISKVIVDKYCDHQPLYRQSERFARDGIDLDRSTLAGWVGRAGALLAPLANAIGDHVKAGYMLHADETPAPTLAPGKGKTATGYYFGYACDETRLQDGRKPAVWFQYGESRKGAEIKRHLEGYTGYALTDFYSGYNEAIRAGVKRIGCWAHVRRKFFELAKDNASSVATQAVNQINLLYDIERELHGLPPGERRRIRQRRAAPILDGLNEWLENHIRLCVKGSPLAKAIQYARKQWPCLARYADDGRLEIDNNVIERAIRPIALGRKNYLFAGSVAGGHHGAIMYTLMATAKLNGLNPNEYLTAVLKRIGNTPITRVDELLPWNIDLTEAKYTEAV